MAKSTPNREKRPRNPKNPGIPPDECKARGRGGVETPGDGPRGPQGTPEWPRPWFGGWLAEALRVGDVLAACKSAGVTLTELLRARADSPEIDGACREVDQLVNLRVVEAVKLKAMAGDLKAIRAIADGTLGRLDPDSDERKVLEVPATIGPEITEVQCPCGRWHVRVTSHARLGVLHHAAEAIRYERTAGVIRAVENRPIQHPFETLKLVNE